MSAPTSSALASSTSRTPTLIGSFKSLGQTKIGDIFDTKVVFIDHMEGLVMIEVSNEAEPVAAGSFFLDGYARDVTAFARLRRRRWPSNPD